MVNSKEEASDEEEFQFEEDCATKRRKTSSAAVFHEFFDAKAKEKEKEPEVQWREKEQSVRTGWGAKDILHKIGQNWAPGPSQWTNPGIAAARGQAPGVTLIVSGIDSVASGNNPATSIFDTATRGDLDAKGCVFTVGEDDDDDDDAALPFIVIDMHDIRVQLTEYELICPWKFHYEGGSDCNVPFRWSIHGSNDIDNDGWTIIQADKRQRNTKDDREERTWNPYHRRSKIRNGSAADRKIETPFYSKFCIRMDAPCWNATDKKLTGRKLFIIKCLELYGNVKRTAHRIERMNEIKQMKDFPKLPKNRCCGDVDLLLGLFDAVDQSNADVDEFKDAVNDIPDLAITLKDYQLRGVAWMLQQEASDRGGGWLCDEMGLGKTVQTIALLLAQRARLPSGQRERTLIITPLSLIDQWHSELDKIAKPGVFKVLSYYGAAMKKMKRADLEAADVVLSTTATFGNIVGKLTKEWDDFADAWWYKGHTQKLLYGVEDGFFARMVVDEAHEIKKNRQQTLESAVQLRDEMRASMVSHSDAHPQRLPLRHCWAGALCRYRALRADCTQTERG